ncbi:MAG: hypothetical protein WCA28_00460 [Bradyrhizobium sp.]
MTVASALFLKFESEIGLPAVAAKQRVSPCYAGHPLREGLVRRSLSEARLVPWPALIGAMPG